MQHFLSTDEFGVQLIVSVRKRFSCDECRRRKRKCDRAKPICEICKGDGSECAWTNAIRRSQPVSRRAYYCCQLRSSHTSKAFAGCNGPPSPRTSLPGRTSFPETQIPWNLDHFLLPGTYHPSIRRASMPRLADVLVPNGFSHWLRSQTRALSSSEPSKTSLLHTMMASVSSFQAVRMNVGPTKIEIIH